MTELFDSYATDIEKSFLTVKQSISGCKQAPLSKHLILFRQKIIDASFT